MLYIQKSVSKNARNAGLRVEKYEDFPVREFPLTPTITHVNHLLSLHIQYSMVPFCKWSPPPLTNS